MTIDLEPSPQEFHPIVDRRTKMPEPLPVRLVAVEDVRLPAPAGREIELDAFYVTLLQFERVGPADQLIYRADNFRLNFQVLEAPVVHEILRPLGIEVPSLAEVEHNLIDSKLDYVRQRGLVAGEESLILQDPAGNWIELVEMRPVR